MKNVFGLAIFFLLMLSVAACTNSESEISLNPETTKQSIAEMKDILSTSLNMPVFCDSDNKESTRAVVANVSGKTPVYLNASAQTNLLEPVDKKQIMSTADLLVIKDVYDVDFSSVKTLETVDSVYFDDDAAKVALAPTIEQAKRYFYDKGLTEQDMAEILAEVKAEGIGEEMLVVVALTCMEMDYSNMTRATYNVNGRSITVDWNKIGKCAGHAIWKDFTYFAPASTLKVWLKQAIKQSAKVVLKRTVALWGVMILVFEFADCWYGWVLTD